MSANIYEIYNWLYWAYNCRNYRLTVMNFKTNYTGFKTVGRQLSVWADSSRNSTMSLSDVINEISYI